jgi:hypothetical protein
MRSGCSSKIRIDVQSVRQREEFSSGCSSGFGLGRMFLNWLFDSLTQGVPVVSTAGASSLKSSAWYGVVFITLSMGLMAVFASNQAHAKQVYEHLQADKVYEYFAGTTNVPGATVRINKAVGKTDSKGSFGFHAKKAKRYAISVKKLGYALVSQIEQQPSTSLSFTLKEAEVISLDMKALAKDGFTVLDSRKTQIKLPPNAFGDSVDEQVNAHVYTYDLANESMPGDMSVEDRDGYLESAGVFSTEFVGESGTKYNLVAGKEATISMPASVGDELPGLWYYNETTGKWVEGNSDSVNLVDGRLQGKVGHFSTWNFDWYKKKPACFEIKAADSFFVAYGNSVQIKANVKSSSMGSRPPQEGPISNSNRTIKLINLPPDSRVDVYFKRKNSISFMLIKQDQVVGPGSNNQNCNSVELKGTPIVSLDKLAVIFGDGNGIPFSWVLTLTDSVITTVKGYKQDVTVSGTDVDVGFQLFADMRPLSLGVVYKGDNSINIGKHTLYVGTKDQNAGITVGEIVTSGSPTAGILDQMCQVTRSNPCPFNPKVQLITKKQAVTTIKGVIWADVDNNGLRNSGEKVYPGLSVKLSPGNRTTLTDEYGYYKFTDLSADNYTVSIVDRLVQVYTTDKTVIRTVGNIYTDENIRIPRSADFGIQDISNLALNIIGGSISVNGSNCNSLCRRGYNVTKGAQLNLTVKPNKDYSFDKWTGDCAGENPTTSVVMDAHKTCTATMVGPVTPGPGTPGPGPGTPGPGTPGPKPPGTVTPPGTPKPPETVTPPGTVTPEPNGSNTGGTILDDFDGNGDGTKDGKQDNVVSISSPEANNVKLTVQTSNGCALRNVQIKRDASLSIPDGRTFPYGLVEFEAACAETQITMYYYVDMTDKDGKFSSTSTNENSEWYTLPGQSTKFVKVGNKSAIKVSFNLKDGELGDNTGKDGKIVSISGLALIKPTNTEYVLETPPDRRCYVKPTENQCVTEPVDMQKLIAYCADGCQITLGIKDNPKSVKGPFRFTYSDTTKPWEVSSLTPPISGQDKNGSVQHILELEGYTCYFTDGEYVNHDNSSDAQKQLGLLKWTEIEQTQACVLVIRD